MVRKSRESTGGWGAGGGGHRKYTICGQAKPPTWREGKGTQRLELRTKVMGSEGKAQADVVGPFGSEFGILPEFRFYSPSSENTPESFKQESGLI